MLDFKEKVKTFIDKTEDEILQYLFNYWGIDYTGHSFKLIVGGYEKSSKPDKNENEFGFFQEVRSLKGDILYYPFRLGLISLFTMHKTNITSNDYWLVDVKLNNRATRDKLKNPFALSLANNVFGKPRNTFLELVDKEKFIKEIFYKRGATADDAGLISRAINKLAGDMYTDLSERFVFELLQNADDMPKDNNGVNVKLHLLENNILFIHNGLPFSKDDIKAITDIGNSTKKKNPSQTGYKGIGFKIVFQESENVLIKSGGFSFSFDKNHPYYDALKRSIYDGLTNDEIPWQLKPIWTEQYRYDTEIQKNSEFMNSNTEVALAINTDRVNQFRTDITSLLQEPRFILFLRNIKSIKVDGISSPVEITKNKSGKAISLKSNNEHLSDWLTFDDIEIKISDDVKDAIISDKAVPPKLKEIDSTKINFICQVIDDKITPIAPETSFLFTYLPTNVNDYKFPFLVNADFLTTANRQSIHIKNKWNLFLFEEIGRNCIKWIAEIANSAYNASAYNLLPNTENSINDLPWQSFYSGYTKALNETEFILTENENLIKLKDACIDNTGFSKYVDSSTLKSLLNFNGELISKKISDSRPIARAIEEFNQGKIITINDLTQCVSNESFKNWLIKPDNNIVFLKYLSENGLLDLFATLEVFLSTDLQLYKSNELFTNLGLDHKELIWLDFKKVLHQTVSFSLSEISLPLKQYEPISFIKDIICNEQKNEIISSLTNGSILFNDVYSYLSKYANNPLFPAAEIKSFPLQTKHFTLPNWSSSIYFISTPLNTLISNKSLPTDLFHLLDDKWNSETNPELKELAVKLGVLTFLETEPFHFIQSTIVANKEKISNSYLSEAISNINANATLWSFIISAFNNISEPQKEGVIPILKLFPVLSKKGVFKELHSLYLPSEFTDNDALETLSVQFPNSNIDFVSADYLKQHSIDKNELKTLFRRLDAKIDTKDFLQHTLLPNLQQIADDLFVPFTKLIYENRESEQIINYVLSDSSFKLKTKDGSFKTIRECFVGAPFIDEALIPNPLDFVPVINQVSAEYSDTHLDAWRKFFSEKLKVNSLTNEQEMLSLKLKYITENIEIWKFKQKSISLLNELFSIFKLGTLSMSGNNLIYLKKIPLLCKSNDDSYVLPSMIHFSSAYKPAIDLEKIFGSDCGVPFLSDLYKFDDTPELIQFFELIGVTQLFDQNRHGAICQNIPTADGQKKPAIQLFKYEFKKYVGQSNIAFEDLSKFTHNGRTLEDDLKFKSKLDVASILSYINANELNRNGLKDLISKLLNVYTPNNDRNLINAFITQGKLLTTAKSYNSIGDLHLIDDSIRSGIRENEYLIDPLFSKQEQDRDRYLKLFNIKNLKIEDFNPHYENENADFEFTKRVNDRLLFLAFDNDSENYLEIEKVFKDKFEQWKINKCSKISLKYPATESKIIKEDSKTFEIINEKVFYYIGSWSDPRVNPVLVDCLSKNILGLYKQRAFIQDMLLNDPIAIIEDFENKGRVVPDEIKLRFIKPQPTQQEPITPEPTQPEATTVTTGVVVPKPPKTVKDILSDATEDEIKYITEIINISRDKDGQIDANTTAKIKTLKFLKDNGDASAITDQGRYLQVGNDKVIVRSAQKGLLYLDLYDWGELNDENVKIAIYTNSQITIFNSQEDLFQFCHPKNKFGVLRMPDDYTLDDYNSIDDIKEKSRWHFVFIVNKDAKAAMSYNEVMNLDDYNF